MGDDGAGGSAPHVRPYAPADRADVYRICLLTGDAGQDATALFVDPDLLADVYAGPYLALEPGLASVLDDGTGTAVGYVLGTADTARFAAAVAERWLPQVLPRRVPPPADPSPAEAAALDALLHPERTVDARLAPHPAHLHVDLLPAYQGQGWGRVLLRTFVAAARAAGAPSLHLGYAPTNTSAAAFYARLGLRPVPGLEHTVWAPTDLPL